MLISRRFERKIMDKYITMPITEETTAELKAGDYVYLTGTMYVAEGRPIGSAGPTTATRMDKYAPRLLDLGEKAMIGKGKRSKEVVDAVIRNHAVYFAAIGGAGALLSKCITKSDSTTPSRKCSRSFPRNEVQMLAVSHNKLCIGEIKKEPFGSFFFRSYSRTSSRDILKRPFAVTLCRPFFSKRKLSPAFKV